jgi:hypothetical protein
LLDGEGTHASNGVAELLGKAGAEVIVLSVNYAPFGNRELMACEGDPIARRLAEAKVDFRGATWAKRIGERDVVAFDMASGREQVIGDVDAVVLATGRTSVDGIARELEGKVAQLFTIGDALCVRAFATAPYEAQLFARLIGSPGAPASFADHYFADTDPAAYPAPAG